LRNVEGAANKSLGLETIGDAATLLFPGLRELSIFLEQPLVAAGVPWVLRRLLARPFKKR
jgi:hypothetical protein